jgi:hypothetical protein
VIASAAFISRIVTHFTVVFSQNVLAAGLRKQGSFNLTIKSSMMSCTISTSTITAAFLRLNLVL